MQTTFPRLMLDHAKQRPRPRRPCARRLWHLARPPPRARPGVLVQAHRLWPARGRHDARRPCDRGRREPPAPVRHACWRCSRLARCRCRCTRTRRRTEYVFPINNAEVRFAIVEDQEQVDKMVELRDSCPQTAAASGTTTRAACAITDEPGPGLGGRADRGRPGLRRRARRLLRRRGGPRPPQDVAAMFFTSGTTGNPKGVVHTHFRPVRPARRRRALDKPASTEEVLAYLPPGLDRPEHFATRSGWLAATSSTAPSRRTR